MGLACNETIADVTLDISCNNLGSQGAHVLESCIHGVRSLSTLDITENSEIFFSSFFPRDFYRILNPHNLSDRYGR